MSTAQIQPVEATIVHSQETDRAVGLDAITDRLKDQLELMDDRLVQGGDMVLDHGNVVLRNGTDTTLKPSRIFVEDLCQKLNMNQSFWTHLKQRHPEVLDYTVTELLKRNNDSYLIRTFRPEAGQEMGIARCLKTPSYKIINNLDVIENLSKVFETFDKTREVECISGDLTIEGMHLRFIFPKIMKHADSILKHYRRPDDHKANNSIGIGFNLTNSEVGRYGLTMSAVARVLVCLNGMALNKVMRFRKKHTGKRQIGKIESMSGYDWAKIRYQMYADISSASTTDVLDDTVHLIEKHGLKPLQHPDSAIEAVCKELSYSEAETKRVAEAFETSQDHTRFGLIQALTFVCQSLSSHTQHETETRALELLRTMNRFDKPAPASRALVAA